MERWSEAIAAQFEAAIKTLENAIDACPEATWTAPCGTTPFWHAAFHALFFLDVYSGGSLEGFEPPAPFAATELEEDGVPTRMYTKEELSSYVQYCREKCRAQIESLTDSDLEERSGFDWLSKRGLSVVESVIYNLRHVQHHAAQLNLVLRQRVDHAAPWVSRRGE